MKIYKSNKRREGCGKARFFDGTHSSPKYTTNINFNSIKMMKNYARTLLHLLDCNIKITQLHMVLKSFSPFSIAFRRPRTCENFFLLLLLHLDIAEKCVCIYSEWGLFVCSITKPISWPWVNYSSALWFMNESISSSVHFSLIKNSNQ